ncbi:hypothetical protein GOP47_0010628 [Adiantum capillus-veneris]|uniref:Uncharacterized protein n=1 Tax=Adiantum capillus-veneris TaxID=13818 RepID=A0A9D4UWD9_ADICA|nr:hypothetical protein GOP47_0010628 [Adiantum capillus-veneris]
MTQASFLLCSNCHRAAVRLPTCAAVRAAVRLRDLHCLAISKRSAFRTANINLQIFDRSIHDKGNQWHAKMVHLIDEGVLLPDPVVPEEGGVVTKSLMGSLHEIDETLAHEENGLRIVPWEIRDEIDSICKGSTTFVFQIPYVFDMEKGHVLGRERELHDTMSRDVVIQNPSADRREARHADARNSQKEKETFVDTIIEEAVDSMPVSSSTIMARKTISFVYLVDPIECLFSMLFMVHRIIISSMPVYAEEMARSMEADMRYYFEICETRRKRNVYIDDECEN